MSQYDEILSLTDRYFQGVYHGNVELLTSLFDSSAQVYGVVSGEPYHKTAADYINGVGKRQSPASLGEPYRMRTLAVDVLGPIANVRLHSPMLGFDYYLYLTFAQRADGWKIVNKTFTHNPAV
ncbi:nuclear transport factor 2 family protein [Paraburkholderia sp. MMS20-SJTN17]|uniref:Nuclear transport factor 2 family protein n=1 Tax=Paraburkholderia translucens TaxID=2886945 RepID=A0ABS8KIP1_9BURK|nr:nuclear transport factor 2 family protein [Paraburkholderia sp. MMS20-SJTN17]MCC8404634.1 nuclear transport factor 2 family protein [Paraburkholderia sp. MMS20-SJTN17]